MLATNKIGGFKSSDKSIGKSIKSKIRKMFKLEKLKSKKLSKPQKLSKSKKPSKSENSFKFTTRKIGTSFLTLKARTAFNYLWLTFTTALIFWYFDSKCHI